MFHSRFNRVLAVVVWLVCVVFVIAFGILGWNASWNYLPLTALAAWLSWAGLWRPALNVTDDAVTIVNVYATTVVPWAALIDVDTRYALTLVTPRHRYPATVAPAPGRLATALSKREMRGINAPTGSDGSVRPGDLPTSDSGAAAHIIRQRWAKLLEENRIAIGMADATPITRHIQKKIILITVGLAAVTAVALIFA